MLLTFYSIFRINRLEMSLAPPLPASTSTKTFPHLQVEYVSGYDCMIDLQFEHR